MQPIVLNNCIAQAKSAKEQGVLTISNLIVNKSENSEDCKENIFADPVRDAISPVPSDGSEKIPVINYVPPQIILDNDNQRTPNRIDLSLEESPIRILNSKKSKHYRIS